MTRSDLTLMSCPAPCSQCAFIQEWKQQQIYLYRTSKNFTNDRDAKIYMRTEQEPRPKRTKTEPNPNIQNRELLRLKEEPWKQTKKTLMFFFL